MSADRDALRDLLGAARGSLNGGVGAQDENLRDAVARVQRHLDRTPEHDCSAEVERASRAAYAAGQARAAGAAP